MKKYDTFVYIRTILMNLYVTENNDVSFLTFVDECCQCQTEVIQLAVSIVLVQFSEMVLMSKIVTIQ